MQSTHNTLSESIRAQSVEVLNKQMTAAVDLHAQMKQAHWSVRGPGFIAIHELFDMVSMVVENYSDLIAERVGGLGGSSHSTIQVAPERHFLVRHPLDFADEHQHVFAVSGRLAAFGQSVWEAIDQATIFGDTSTAELFTEISRGIDLQLWFVESHIAPKMNKTPRSRTPRQNRSDGSQLPHVMTRVSDRPSARRDARRNGPRPRNL
jgi:starvation-inducible DNA-binding protein